MTNASSIINIVKDIYSKVKSNELSGLLIIIFGLLVGTPAANLDMSSHWLSIPETFFSPSHAGVYTGVAIVIFGSILVLRNAYRQRSNHKDTVEYIHKSHFYEHLIPHRWFFRSSVLPLSTKLIFYGVIITILSGPFDLAWHTVFGLDGLLSPSHATLRIGDALSAIGALLGIISTHPVMGSATRSKQYFSLYPIFVIVAILPVIFASRGFISMVTLPFSNTYNFQWNPDPLAAAIIATVSFPFFISLLLYLSFRLANFNTIIFWNKDSRSEVKPPMFKFGIITIVGAALIATAVFSIILPNMYLHQTIPLYIFNIIPIIAADILLTMGFSNTSNSNPAKITAELSAGAILGLLFFTLQYPFIAYTYNEVLENPQVIGPTNVHIVYLKTLEVLPWIIAPSIIFGIFGIIVGSRLLSHYAPQQLVRTK